MSSDELLLNFDNEFFFFGIVEIMPLPPPPPPEAEGVDVIEVSEATPRL